MDDLNVSFHAGTTIITKEEETIANSSRLNSITSANTLDLVCDTTFDDESTFTPSGKFSQENVEFETFKGWARVFFQGRKDRSAAQILPLNSSRQSRDSYIYIEVQVNNKKETLHLYPSDNEKILLVTPPINLSHFYAVKVPDSQCGAALFLKEDERYLHRFIFRFEFRNDCVEMPISKYMVQTQYSNFVHHKRTKDKQSMFPMSPKSKTQEEFLEHDENLKRACQTYVGGTHELLKDASEAANRFIEAVNVVDQSVTMRKHMHRVRIWGTGYRDNEKVLPEESDSSISTDSEDDSDSDESYYSQKSSKTETIQQSFEKLFGKVNRLMNT